MVFRIINYYCYFLCLVFFYMKKYLKNLRKYILKKIGMVGYMFKESLRVFYERKRKRSCVKWKLYYVLIYYYSKMLGLVEILKIEK